MSRRSSRADKGASPVDALADTWKALPRSKCGYQVLSTKSKKLGNTLALMKVALPMYKDMKEIVYSLDKEGRNYCRFRTVILSSAADPDTCIAAGMVAPAQSPSKPT